MLSTGCTSPAIYNDPNFNPPVYWGAHYVESGDTLHSIAWRYGRDYREIAAINQINKPYRIVPGQRISLAVPEGFVMPPKRNVTERNSVSRTSGSKSIKPRPSARSDNKKKHKQKQSSYRSRNVAALHWSWPHTGPIIDSYSMTGNINKGVDIAGKMGDPIRAAAGGEVVYAGSGLLGYGKLVIINHSDTYLSAYAHNRSITVKEGEVVKTGQKIAELGDTGTSRPMLHFEIRKDGQPVNPARYLPKR